MLIKKLGMVAAGYGLIYILLLAENRNLDGAKAPFSATRSL